MMKFMVKCCLMDTYDGKYYMSKLNEVFQKIKQIFKKKDAQTANEADDAQSSAGANEVRSLYSTGESADAAAQKPASDAKTPAKTKRKGLLPNWNEDKHNIALVQRNILLVLLVIAMAVILVGLTVVWKVSVLRSFDPFVVQIDQQTGSAIVVNPISSDLLSGDESLTRYFIKKYISARESYNPADYEYNMKTVVRLFSTAEIYRIYLGEIRNVPGMDLAIKYGQGNTTVLNIKSWSRVDGGKYLVRFSLTESAVENKIYHKLAVLQVQYNAMNLKDEERDINPIGFQIISYKVDDDNS